MEWVLKFANIMSGTYTVYLLGKEIYSYFEATNMRWLIQNLASVVIVFIFIGSGAILLYQRYQRNKKVEPKQDKTAEKKPDDHPQDINFLILFQIIKLRSLNQKATPPSIAKQLKNQDAGIVLAHLRKLCGDQFVTHITGGLPPDLDTDFFLTVSDEVFKKIIEYGIRV